MPRIDIDDLLGDPFDSNLSDAELDEVIGRVPEPEPPPIALPIREMAVVAHPTDVAASPYTLIQGAWRKVNRRAWSLQVVSINTVQSAVRDLGYRPVFPGYGPVSVAPEPSDAWAAGGVTGSTSSTPNATTLMYESILRQERLNRERRTAEARRNAARERIGATRTPTELLAHWERELLESAAPTGHVHAGGDYPETGQPAPQVGGRIRQGVMDPGGTYHGYRVIPGERLHREGAVSNLYWVDEAQNLDIQVNGISQVDLTAMTPDTTVRIISTDPNITT